MIDRHVLLSTLTDQLASLRAASPRARVRVLTGADVESFVDALLRAETFAKADDVHLAGKLVGGFVPNAYGSVGSTDRAEVSIDLRTGATVTLVRRAVAETRPHGKGSAMVVRLARADQAVGRVVVAR